MLAFSLSLALMLAIGASSYWLSSEIEWRVEHLRARFGADLERVDARHHAVEIEGRWDRSGEFIATEVDLLPGRRRPKLRGALQSVDPSRGSVRLFGVEIAVPHDVEFLAGENAAKATSELRPGQRIEISARLDDDGHWIARKIKSAHVKSSDQVKGTPTRIDLHPGGGMLSIAGIDVMLQTENKPPAGSALRRLRLVTLVVVALKELETAAGELVGRTDDWKDFSVPSIVSNRKFPASSTMERLGHSRGAFAYSLEQLIAFPITEDTPRNQIGSLAKILGHRFETLEEQLALLEEFAGDNPNRASGYFEKVIAPHIDNAMLPVVDAMRAEAEENLNDEAKGISTWTRNTTRVATVLTLLCVAVTLILGTIVWRSIDAPVSALHRAALRIGEGQFDTRVDLKVDGEFGVLAGAFNQMTEALANTTVSVKSLESIFDSIAGILITMDSDCIMTNVNRGALELLGYQREDLLGRPFELICARFDDGTAEFDFEDNNVGIATVKEIYLVRRDGSAVPVSFSSAEILNSQGTPQGYVCVAQDLTERKEIEAQVHASLAEKDLLLRELHHRVKNNMQVVSSFLAIQASYASNDEVVLELEESQRRIQAMALIHEQLHHATQSGSVDVADYLRSLVHQIGESFGYPGTIEVDLYIHRKTEGVDQALLCGLIVNELVTNSLKHAFGARQQGRSGVGLRDEDDGKRVLEVWDDGPGLVQVSDPDRRSLGLKLVDTLAKSLEGDFIVVPGRGARFRISFDSGAYNDGVAA